MQFRHARLEDTGCALIVGCAERGDLTMPQQLMEAAAQLEQFADQQYPTDESEKAVNHVVTLFNRLSREQLITDHIQPALDEYMGGFRSDLALVGKYASDYTIPQGLLTEPEEVRLAYLRHINSAPRYDSIRRCWELLFRQSGGDSLAYLQQAKSLTEVRNLPDLVSNWHECEKGRANWPWGPNYPWVKLAWLANAGGAFWCPTLSEMNTAWTKYQSKGAA